MKKLFSFSIIAHLAFLLTGSVIASECKASRDAFLESYEALYKEYSAIDPDHKMTEIKKAFWIDGDPKINKAIFVAHGYMGTPAEMLNAVMPYKQKGYSIVGFLIPGHGASYKIANSFKNTVWIEQMKKSLDLVTRCFNHVQAVGFSTGGLLLHHYLLTNPQPISLKKLHLISPYYIQRFSAPFERFLGKIVNGTSVDTAYFISRFRDLKVMTIDREFYNQELPVDAGLQVKELGLKVNQEMKAEKKLAIPVQLFLSEGDWTVHTDSTKEVINRDFEHVSLVWYKGNEPHHLMCPSVSGVASEIQRLIYSF